MTLYKISKKHFTPTTFVVNNFGEVWTDNKELGFFKHPEIKNEFQLQEFITKMNNNGFSVEVVRL